MSLKNGSYLDIYSLTPMVFLKYFFEQDDSENKESSVNKKHELFPSMPSFKDK